MDVSEEYSKKGYGYMCNICSVFLNTDKVLQDHLKGKKHQKVLSLRKSWKDQEERSIFVGGLQKGTSELQLIDYFSNFGPVSNVIFDKDQGKYAIVELESQDVAEKILDEKEHKMAGHKLTVKPRRRKEFIPKAKAKRSRGGKQKESDKKNVISQEDLKNVLSRETSISGQMKALMECTQLTPEDVRLRYLICKLLQEIFQEFFPGCLVFPYGSSINGFGSLGCDLDLQLEMNGKDCKFIVMPEEFRDTESKSLSGNTEGSAGPSGGKPDDGDDEDEDGFDVDNADPEEVMELIVKIIKKCAPGCKQVKAITTARCPVVKFTHADSGMACDIAINNRLAMENTELLHMYGNFDERVRPMVYVVRHWAKLKHLAGNDNYAGPRLSNYALTLMVMYFLQQAETLVIPTVEQLQNLCDESDVTVIDGWNCSFVRNFDESNIKKTDKRLDELLMEFFKFYSEFDYAHNVICPLTGKPLPVDGIVNQPLPDDKTKFKVTPLCVQDPFELNHNVAMNVNAATLQNLVHEMEQGRQLFEQGQLSMTQPSGSTQQNIGLVKLFAATEKSKRLSESGSGAGDKDYTMHVAFQKSKVPESVIQQYENNEELKIAWFEKVVEFFQAILVDILMFDCKIERKDDISKFSSTDTEKGQGDGHHVAEHMDDSNLEDVTEEQISGGDESNGDSGQPKKKRRIETESLKDGDDVTIKETQSQDVDDVIIKDTQSQVADDDTVKRHNHSALKCCALHNTNSGWEGEKSDGSFNRTRVRKLDWNLSVKFPGNTKNRIKTDC
ncbi:speckle targeted PIP5K1A-regulated poly(A) polymerase-like [Ptychodera flava]|uniref:speckle targeted PIP5K1A-regulated poly(A) polymerase-like n=1 Tax=Ptychodera flava TaxID=63121 RepID=UPI00396A2060